YQAPEGGGDTHFSVMRGSRSDLVIRQGAEQNYKPTLFVEPVSGEVAQEVGEELERVIEGLNRNGYEGVQAHSSEHGWRLEIPDEYHKGHEAHFGKVAQDYFNYLVEGEMASWEVPNMITKYYITTQARELALEKSQ
ncbi:MAG: putative oxidoreductase C-terminal domain-containing protein, partial [Bacteroidota bacterium]